MSVKIILPMLLLGLALLWTLSVFFLSLYAYRALFYPKQQSIEHAKNYGLERGEFDNEFLELPWEYVRIPADHRAAALYAMLLQPLKQADTAGTALFVHGITWNRYGMLKYMQPFVEKGWRVIALDLGGHGDSPRGTIPSPSYGYHEKYDIQAAITWIEKTFETYKPVILIGESMGAATVLQYAPLGAPADTDREKWHIDAIIADCPYSSAADELDARMKAMHVPSFVSHAVRRQVSRYSQWFRAYTLEDISPKQAIMNTNVPILFVHGSRDTYVPTWMSEQMALERQKAGIGPTELLIVSDASHAKSILADRDMWFSWAFDFLAAHIQENTQR